MSDALPVVYHLKLLLDHQIMRAGDGRRLITIPSDVDGLSLIQVEMSLTTASGSGDVVVQIRNITNGNVDVLTDPVTIDDGTLHSDDSASPYLINAGNAGMTFKDVVAFDFDQDGTDAKGLEAVLYFGNPLVEVPPSTMPEDVTDPDAEGIAFAFASDTHATPTWERVDVTS